jgi:valyl-tRNA synthetase
VRIKPLAEPAIAAVRDGRTKFHPQRWENTYFGWMENIRDWCISRQLWWGHRIPAWWCERCENPEPIVAVAAPGKCPKCGGPLRQDDDVLDTWFSSGLWPFSTLGWPDETADLRTYYPTSLLITGFDIIFFWVARMMMLGLRFMNDVPFRDVYITPLVRDQYGKKMTKSRGNVVDPLDIIGRYGTDAVRFTLAQLAVQGRDVILSDERLAASRAFANKIWNAARFAMMNLDAAPQPVPSVDTDKLSLADRWILDRLDAAVREVSAAIDGYEFNIAALRLYQFIWHEFCDWYIELAKEPLKAGGDAQAAARWTLVRVLDSMLRLLHPFMPFISEEIWQVLRPYIDAANLAPHLAIATFPAPSDKPWLSDDERRAMERCIEVTGAVNSLRSLVRLHPRERIEVTICPVLTPLPALYAHETFDLQADVDKWGGYLSVLGRAKGIVLLKVAAGPSDLPSLLTKRLNWCTVAIAVPPEFDRESAAKRAEKDYLQTIQEKKRIDDRLNNPQFKMKATPEAIAEAQQRLDELDSQCDDLLEQMRVLGINRAYDAS